MGGMAALSGLPRSQALAAGADYSGPLWITIHAEGGWDPTSFCDPKGYDGIANKDDPARINNYDKNSIQQIGNFNIAPPPDSFLADGVNYDATLYDSASFFTKYLDKLLVINGIDVQTNSHSNGKLHTWAGRLRSGFPSFAALASGTLAPTLPLSYLVNGGYSYPADLIVPTRMDSRGLAALYEIAFPNRSVSPKNSGSALYFSDTVKQLIAEANTARNARLQVTETLPRVLDAIRGLENARQETGRLADFTTSLDTFASKTVDDFNGRNNAFKLYQQGRLVLSGFESGVTCSANITMGGFDTHGQHDEKHYPRLMDLLLGIDGIIQEAELRGLSDRIVLAIGSEFGRTNKYNKNNGKDHWPVTSMMLMGNSVQKIGGNRVIGATDDLQKSVKIDPNTLLPDFDGLNDLAIKLTPAPIHHALRQLSGVDQTLEALRFPLLGSNLRIF